MISHSLCGMVLHSPQSCVFDSFGPCGACAGMCLYSPTGSCWSPGSCMTRRKLLADIWAHGMKYTGDAAALVSMCLNILPIQASMNTNQCMLMKPKLHTNTVPNRNLHTRIMAMNVIHFEPC